jgi:hypothetical protein
MTSMTEHTMGLQQLPSNSAGEAAAAGRGTALHDIRQQCLRILRCTAAALANSPGGLRFKAGTRPWLDGLSSGQPASHQPAARATMPHRLQPLKPSSGAFFQRNPQAAAAGC